MKHDIIDHLYDEAYPLALLAAEMQQKLDALELYKIALDMAIEKYFLIPGEDPESARNVWIKHAKQTITGEDCDCFKTD